VKLGVCKSLDRFVSMYRGGLREIYKIKFEKMPQFFGVCGMIAHSHLECRRGEFNEDKLSGEIG
jgi:hypothetical protein